MWFADCRLIVLLAVLAPPCTLSCTTENVTNVIASAGSSGSNSSQGGASGASGAPPLSGASGALEQGGTSGAGSSAGHGGTLEHGGSGGTSAGHAGTPQGGAGASAGGSSGSGAKGEASGSGGAGASSGGASGVGGTSGGTSGAGGAGASAGGASGAGGSPFTCPDLDAGATWTIYTVKPGHCLVVGSSSWSGEQVCRETTPYDGTCDAQCKNWLGVGVGKFSAARTIAVLPLFGSVIQGSNTPGDPDYSSVCTTAPSDGITP